MKISVLLFAHLKEMVGSDKVELELEEGSVGSDILDRLEELYPEIKKQRGFMMLSLNNEYMAKTDPVVAGSEIAVFPPVSGG